MVPRLRVLAGTSMSDMVTITDLVNMSKPYKLASDLFEGEIIVHIKGFTDENGNVRDSEYFAREDRQGITWSIQVQGRFLVPQSADNILFGNIFDRPLQLPWGTGAVLKFMHFVDPTLEHDLMAQSKPWALSPLISTMPHFAHKRCSENVQIPSFPPTESVKDSTDMLHFAVVEDSAFSSPCDSSPPSPSPSSSSVASEAAKNSRPRSVVGDEIQHLNGALQRRAYFSDEAKRKAIMFGPEDLITTDFCYGFLNFTPTLSLQLPGGLSFDLMRYWDGQPVRFVCCERGKQKDEIPWGRIFWCVSIEVADENSLFQPSTSRKTGL